MQSHTRRSIMETNDDRILKKRRQIPIKVSPEISPTISALPTILDKEYVNKDKFNQNRSNLRKNDTFLATLAVMTLVFGNIEYDIYFENDNQSNDVTDAIRIINL